MAITGTQLADNVSGADADASSYATGSFTPSANKLVLAAVYAVDLVAAAAPTGLSGNGLTWEKVDDVTVAGIINISLWRAMGASPSTGALTATFDSAQIGCLISVSEHGGVNTGGSNGSAAVTHATHANGTGTALLVTLPTFTDATNDGTYGVFASGNIPTQTQGSGFTKLSDVFGFDPQGRMFAEWKATSDTSVDGTLSTSQNWYGIAVELVAVPTGITSTLGEATETDTATAMTLAKTVAVGEPSETDTATAVSILRDSQALGQATESDTGQPVVMSRTAPVGEPVETDTAQPVTWSKIKTLGQAIETDTGQPVTISKTLALAVSQLIFTGQSFGNVPAPPNNYPTLLEGLLPSAWYADDFNACVNGTLYVQREATAASDVDAHVSSSHRSVMLDVGGPTDIANNFTAAQILGWAETYFDNRRAAGVDFVIGFTATPSTIYSAPQDAVRLAYNDLLRASTHVDAVCDMANIPELSDPTNTTYYDGSQLHPTAAGALLIAQLARETLGDLGFPISDTAFQAVETDTAQPVTIAKVVTIGMAVETDTGQSVLPIRMIPIGQASETDTATSVAWSKIKLLGQAVETDSGQGVTDTKTVTVGDASEADTATASTMTKTVGIGEAIETETSQPVSVFEVVSIGQASETDTGSGVIPSKTTSIGQPSEVDTATTVTAPKTKVLGEAIETESAQVVITGLSIVLGSPSETDTATATVSSKTSGLGEAIEIDTATGIVDLSTVVIGEAVEVDTGRTLMMTQGLVLGIAQETDTATSTAKQKTIVLGSAGEVDVAFALMIAGLIPAIPSNLTAVLTDTVGFSGVLKTSGPTTGELLS